MQIKEPKQASKLNLLRKELGYTQEDFAIYAQLRIKTYRRAEQTGGTSYPTAKGILKAQNELRTTRELPVLTLEDLELKIT